ncbi:MAG: cellulase family glycosylhydrolase [Chloroflexaceae bacterium]|nr:cellulase family glycosylhydrolase [Chloroflexaceae bacterium]
MSVPRSWVEAKPVIRLLFGLLITLIIAVLLLQTRPSLQLDQFFPPSIGPFGVEVNQRQVQPQQQRLAESNVTWVRYNGLLWSEIEPEPGERNEEALATFEADLKAIADTGAMPMVVVRSTPPWAQAEPGISCGPIREDALDDFAQFMADMAERYREVQFWEIWNEPDVDPSLIPEDFPYGCWGDADDPYYGGARYADMLKRVYPAIKEANPEAWVVMGGLMLDCDPEHPVDDEPCIAGRFLEGVLQAGGGHAFNLLAYHSYAYWSAERVDWELNHAKWQHRGGALRGRLAFLREMLDQYNLHGKYIVLNEGSLLCYNASPSCFQGTFLNDQANYLVRFYMRAWASGLWGAAWYPLNDSNWHESGLMGRRQTPRPAYSTLRFLASLDGNNLSDWLTIEQLSSGILEGYAFRNGKREYRVYWSNNASQIDLTLPAGTRNVYNIFGHGIMPRETFVRVGFDPIIIERVLPNTNTQAAGQRPEQHPTAQSAAQPHNVK